MNAFSLHLNLRPCKNDSFDGLGIDTPRSKKLAQRTSETSTISTVSNSSGDCSPGLRRWVSLDKRSEHVKPEFSLTRITRSSSSNSTSSLEKASFESRRTSIDYDVVDETSSPFEERGMYLREFHRQQTSALQTLTFQAPDKLPSGSSKSLASNDSKQSSDCKESDLDDFDDLQVHNLDTGEVVDFKSLSKGTEDATVRVTPRDLTPRDLPHCCGSK